MASKAIRYAKELIRRGGEKLSEVDRLLRESEKVTHGYTTSGKPCLYCKGKDGKTTVVTQEEILGATEDIKIATEGLFIVNETVIRSLKTDTEDLKKSYKLIREGFSLR